MHRAGADLEVVRLLQHAALARPVVGQGQDQLLKALHGSSAGNGRAAMCAGGGMLTDPRPAAAARRSDRPSRLARGARAPSLHGAPTRRVSSASPRSSPARGAGSRGAPRRQTVRSAGERPAASFCGELWQRQAVHRQQQLQHLGIDRGRRRATGAGATDQPLPRSRQDGTGRRSSAPHCGHSRGGGKMPARRNTQTSNQRAASTGSQPAARASMVVSSRRKKTSAGSFSWANTFTCSAR